MDVSGQISYNGKSISKFYVDGKDMVGDSYAMVSKNLSAGKVDSVEILQIISLSSRCKVSCLVRLQL